LPLVSTRSKPVPKLAVDGMLFEVEAVAVL
jgi:hypothetical protein